MQSNKKKCITTRNKITNPTTKKLVRSLANGFLVSQIVLFPFSFDRRQITSSEAEDGHIVFDSEKYIYISGNHNDYKYFCNRVFYSFFLVLRWKQKG